MINLNSTFINFTKILNETINFTGVRLKNINPVCQELFVTFEYNNYIFYNFVLCVSLMIINYLLKNKCKNNRFTKYLESAYFVLFFVIISLNVIMFFLQFVYVPFEDIIVLYENEITVMCFLYTGILLLDYLNKNGFFKNLFRNNHVHSD